jgi:Tfp pilus assembly protein PilX
MKKYLIAIAAIIAISACSKKEAAFNTVEEQRAQGRANAYAVAAEYQRQNPRIQGWEAIVKADNSHTADCPQGDGWTEVVFMRTDRADGSTKNLTVEKATVMCSTVSVNEGCVMVAPVNNWDKHPKKIMDGQCGKLSEVPMPLPRVAGAKN